jgi:hypothetical protein
VYIYGDDIKMNPARFEVLTATLIKIYVFWDTMKCRLVNSDISGQVFASKFRVSTLENS